MVKVEHDGSLDKSNWTVYTNNLKADAILQDATEEMPCEQVKVDPVMKAFDNDFDTVYEAQIEGDVADIRINFNQTLTISGFKYTAGDETAVFDYAVYADEGKTDYTCLVSGTLSDSETVYFSNSDEKYISTYSTSNVFIMITPHNEEATKISVAEFDFLGVTGDNVDFRRTEEESTPVIGTLSEDYKYGENDDEVIPKDSLIFTGSYKGNPAYNVVILYDVNGNIVGGVDDEENTLSQQIILADVPDNSNITNVSDGTWIYWIEPDQMENMEMPEMVRVELYRVNNALTNEGQRLVSDSLLETVPEKLPTITLNGNEK